MMGKIFDGKLVRNFPIWIFLIKTFSQHVVVPLENYITTRK